MSRGAVTKKPHNLSHSTTPEDTGGGKTSLFVNSGPDSPDSVGWSEARTLRLVPPGGQFELELGDHLAPVDVEYETYGALNSTRDNVILISHALSGDAHVAGWDAHAEDSGRPWRANRPGWWDAVVGPGKAIDTTKYFVVCANVLGSCYGTTGPSSIDPRTGEPYGLRFPMVTIGDWVRQQAALLDALGIGRVHAVIGGSIGGQQAIEFAMAYPERVGRCIVLAASARLSTQGLAFNAVGRHSIMNDPNFNGGDYYGREAPSAGLSAARMLAHITYLSDAGMHDKFGRRLRGEGCPECGFGIEFEVESYLDHQGRAFVERFDANSYLYITRAMDYFDAAASWGGGDLTEACRRIRARVLTVSFDSDWLYPPEGSRELAHALMKAGKPVTYVNVPSHYGHDAFLVETGPVSFLLRNFLGENEARPVLWSPVNNGTVDEKESGGEVTESNSNSAEIIAEIKLDSSSSASSSAAPLSSDVPVGIFSRWQDKIISLEIPNGASVLDLGCGGGALLSRLSRLKNVHGQGIELDPDAAFECARRGVPVYQADIDEGLKQLPDACFDYVILEETLQTVRRPAAVLNEMLRIGRRGIVSFPNFAFHRLVDDLSRRGRMPVGGRLPYKWHETPNIHLFTIHDFLDWAAERGIKIIKAYAYVDGAVRELLETDNGNAEEALMIVES